MSFFWYWEVLWDYSNIYQSSIYDLVLIMFNFSILRLSKNWNVWFIAFKTYFDPRARSRPLVITISSHFLCSCVRLYVLTYVHTSPLSTKNKTIFTAEWIVGDSCLVFNKFDPYDILEISLYVTEITTNLSEPIPVVRNFFSPLWLEVGRCSSSSSRRGTTVVEVVVVKKRNAVHSREKRKEDGP